MAGTLTDRQLIVRATSRVEFTLATVGNDPAIRRLLRENPLRGGITLSFEREPDYFRGTPVDGGEDSTILAFENDRLICMGRCSVHRHFVNGEVQRVGYLADLRLDASARGRFDVLRRGYQFFRELHRDDPPDFYFTSLTADNDRSIRFLERGLPGMPAYELLTGFVTLVVPVPSGAGGRRRLVDSAAARLRSAGVRLVAGTAADLPGIVACLNAGAKQFQLARAWTERDLWSLASFGLNAGDFQMAWCGTKLVACTALWDQRSFKQTVIRGYSPKLSLARRWINLAAQILGSARLPSIGSTLAYGSLSPLAVDPDRDELLIALIESALPVAAERGLDFVTVGFAANDRRATVVRNHFRCREFFSRLYGVRWNRMISAAKAFDGRPFCPEIAFL